MKIVKLLKKVYNKIFRITARPKKGNEYFAWINNNEPKVSQIDELKEFVPKYKYKFSFIVSDNIEEDTLDSIKAQTYSNYEIIKVDKDTNVNDVVKESNADYIVFLYDNCVLSFFALYEVLKKLETQNSDVIYSDSDKLEIFEEDGKRRIKVRKEPIFRVDFAIDTLRATNYIGNAIFVKKESIEKNNIKLNKYDNNFIYDSMFKFYENNLLITHIPKMLYHELWNKDKYYNENEEIEIIKNHLNRLNLSAKVEKGINYKQYRIVYDINNRSKISIIIPNMDHINDLKKCVESIKKSTYDNYEIIIVENNSKNNDTFEYYNILEKDDKIKILKCGIEYFNFSKIINFGVQNATGEYIVLLNNDVEILTNNWLENMLMYAQRKDVGVVGVKLLFNDNSIQHAGVIIGIRGLARSYV